MSAMHSDHYSPRYMPTSPLSPRLSSQQNSLSPPPTTHRSAHSKQASRNFHMDLPSYSSTYGHRSSAATPTSATQSPAISLHRRPQPTPMEVQQKSMSRGQRDFLKQLQLSSTLAASPMSQKPGAPRLDPLGSPKGPVTPLALEQHEAGDYFAVTRTGRFSPAGSPSARTSRSDRSDKEERTKKKKKKVDLFQ